jgi:hypothetical protein
MLTHHLINGSALVAGVAAASTEAATTLAYWQFEETLTLEGVRSAAVAGQTLTSNGHTPVNPRPFTYDSSGNNNHLRIWNGNEPAPSVFSSDVPRATLANGSDNNLSFSFNNRDLWTEGGNLASANLSAGWTVEASVKVANLNAWQVFVGKDRSTATNNGPDFALKFSDANKQLFISFRGTDNVLREVFTGVAPVQNEWYDVATTAAYDGATTTLSIYVKPSSQEQFGTPVVATFSTGALNVGTGTWTVGRGFWGGIADPVLGGGGVDEVRISSGVVETSQLLANVPEPAALSIAPLAALLLRRRGQSKTTQPHAHA